MKEIYSKPDIAKGCGGAEMPRILWEPQGTMRKTGYWHRGFIEGFLQVVMEDKRQVNEVNQRKLNIPGRGSRVGKGL